MMGRVDAMVDSRWRGRLCLLWLELLFHESGGRQSVFCLLFTERVVLCTYDGAVDVMHFSLDKSESKQGATGQKKEEESPERMGWDGKTRYNKDSIVMSRIQEFDRTGTR